MLDHSAAGRAAVDVLIQEGKLVPDFWLRTEEVGRSPGGRTDFDLRERQIANAVRFAMGQIGFELPNWASPMKDAPDCVWVDPEFRKAYPTTEPYYWPGMLARTFIKCKGDVDLDTNAGLAIRRSYVNLSWRAWDRLVPHFSERISDNIRSIENERGNNGRTFSKKNRIDSILSGAAIRDNALYDFYIEQGDRGLASIFHGIGKKAILATGAMLFLSGEHDDLLHASEQLQELLNHEQRSAE